MLLGMNYSTGGRFQRNTGQSVRAPSVRASAPSVGQSVRAPTVPSRDDFVIDQPDVRIIQMCDSRR